jgi:hypothetical protein
MDYATKYAKLAKMISELNNEVKGISESLDATVEQAGTLSGLCTLYSVIRDLDESLEEPAKALSKILQHLSVTVLPRKFQDDGVSTITLKEIGARFTVNTRLSASMTNKDRAMEWMKDEGYESLIIPTVNSSTLAKFAAEYTLEQGKDLPSDFFKVSSIQHMSRTKV